MPAKRKSTALESDVRKKKFKPTTLLADAKVEAAAAALLIPADCSGIDIEPDLCCPITSVLMSDPVVSADGQSYEREALKSGYRRIILHRQPTIPCLIKM